MKNPLTTWIRALSAALVLATGVLSGTAALAQDKLVVASYPSNPPFETRTPDGQFEGFEVDIANEVGKRLKMPVEFLPFDFQPLFAAVSSSRADFAISSITITPERLKSLSFTQPYYDADAGVGTRKDSAVKKITDLKGKTVGYIAGTTSEAWVKANEGPLGFQSKSYKTLQDMVLDLNATRVDAVLSDVPTLEYTFLKTKGLAVSDRIPGDQRYGLMMRKNHPLLDKINAAISAMKKDGTLAALHKKHFGTDAPAASSTIKEFPIPQ
jgi:polar amino acid transport system substrate-binding protein